MLTFLFQLFISVLEVLNRDIKNDEGIMRVKFKKETCWLRAFIDDLLVVLKDFFRGSRNIILITLMIVNVISITLMIVIIFALMDTVEFNMCQNDHIQWFPE